MSIPRQVQEQMKELEKIEAQLAAEQNPAQEPKATDAPVDPQPAQPIDTDPALAPEPAPEVKAEKPVDPPVADEKWEQKYKTLKGMYDAEVPRLHAQLKDLTARLDNIQRAPEPKAEPKAAAVHEKLVTDADVQAFGEDLIEVQRKVAREVASEFRKDLDDLKAENVKLREQLNTTGNKVSESTFETRLHRLVPDFEEVNIDPRWIDWLNEVDPLLRGPRKSVAEQAYVTGDAEGVAHYVKMFKETLGTVEQPKPKAAELERQIQPSRSAASAPSTSQKGKVYTDSQIQDLYRKASQMASRGQLDDARKLEAEIDSAFMEGRVTA
jgi:hypothetical protein